MAILCILICWPWLVSLIWLLLVGIKVVFSIVISISLVLFDDQSEMLTMDVVVMKGNREGENENDVNI